MDIKALEEQISDIVSKLNAIDEESNQLAVKLRNLEISGWDLRRDSGLTSLKAQAARKLLKDTHRLASDHEACGSDDQEYGFGFVGDDSLAEEVRFLVVRHDFGAITSATLSEPGFQISLEECYGSFDADQIAHGSTEEEAWAMAYDLHCKKS